MLESTHSSIDHAKSSICQPIDLKYNIHIVFIQKLLAVLIFLVGWNAISWKKHVPVLLAFAHEIYYAAKWTPTACYIFVDQLQQPFHPNLDCVTCVLSA